MSEKALQWQSVKWIMVHSKAGSIIVFIIRNHFLYIIITVLENSSMTYFILNATKRLDSVLYSLFYVTSIYFEVICHFPTLSVTG